MAGAASPVGNLDFGVLMLSAAYEELAERTAGSSHRSSPSGSSRA
ncbi:hypothetical protein ACIQUQ_30295 [Streptomyces sp. NPDC101118]